MLLGSTLFYTRNKIPKRDLDRQVEPNAVPVECNELLQARVHQGTEESRLGVVITAADIGGLVIHDGRPEKVYHDGDCA